jgi:hypothetical protein
MLRETMIIYLTEFGMISLKLQLQASITGLYFPC